MAVSLLFGSQLPAPSSQTESWYLPDYSLRAEVPYQDHDGGMLVYPTVNGKQIPMLWDTGAQGTFCPKSVLESRAVNMPNAHAAGVAVGIGGSENAFAFDANIKLGTASATIPIAFSDDSSVPTTQRRPCGLLGQDFFGGLVYEVDPSRHVIRILKQTRVDPAHVAFKSAAFSADGANRYATLGEPFHWYQGLMIVTPRINGRLCNMIFDTGADAIAFTREQLASAGIPIQRRLGRNRSVGIGGRVSSLAADLGRLELGPASGQIVATVMDRAPYPAGLLGQPFIRQFRYIVDPERQIIRIRSLGG